MTKEFWNERYGNSQYAYGKEPNVFFKEQLGHLLPGKILLPAEGEGRNAVYAAGLGWNVSAFDQSEVGRGKALMLAQHNKVHIDYQIHELEHVDYPKNSMDAIGIVYAHFPSSVRTVYMRKLVDFLRPGGHVIMEVFCKRHVDYQRINEKAGGPKDVDMLVTLEDVRNDFVDFAILYLEEKDIDLHEGPYHQGQAAVIRFVGIKP